MDPTTGRPRKTPRRGKSRITPEQDAYNREQVKILASTGSTLEEAAVMLHISVNTLYRRYLSEFDEGRFQLVRSIKEKQIEVALAGKGHPGMLMFLGLEYCGQGEANREEGSPLDEGNGGGTDPGNSQPPEIVIEFVDGRSPYADEEEEHADDGEEPAATEPVSDNQACRRRS
jgi:hypothetical protein